MSNNPMTDMERRCVDRVVGGAQFGMTPTDGMVRSTLLGVRAVLAEAGVAELIAERDKLQFILDNRPAINTGLPESYIKWSQNIYVIERVAKIGATQ